MRAYRTAKLPLFGVTLVVLAACGSIEEQCRNRYGPSEAAVDQCIERQNKAINRMLEGRRVIQNMSIPDTQ